MKIKSVALVLSGLVVGSLSTAVFATLYQPRSVPDATVASPNQYKVEFENEFVRVIRVRFEPHATMAMHEHPAPGGVIVTLTDQDARLTAPDGTSREVHYKAGQFRPSPRQDWTVLPGRPIRKST